MTKKGVLGILKIYGNFRKRTPDEFYHLIPRASLRTMNLPLATPSVPPTNVGVTGVNILQYDQSLHLGE